MKDRSNQMGNFDRDFPGGRVIVANAGVLDKIPALVRNSVPNTPFVTAAEAGLPESLRNADKNNFNPRLSIAYRPWNDGRTVIRGGVGVYTVPLYGAVNYSMVATVTAVAAAFSNTTPAPAFVFPNVSSAATAQGALPPGSLDFRRANQIDLEDPRVIQWTATVDRDLGWNTGLRLSYVGSRTDDLVMSPDLNQVPANTLGYAAVRDTRPFKDWNAVTSRDNLAQSRYHALGVELSKRYSRGIAFNASYTLAKNIADHGGPAPASYTAENGANITDLFRGDSDRGNEAFTRRHRFVSTFYAELPFGRGRKFGSTINRALDTLVGGWDSHRNHAAAVGAVPDAVLHQRRPVGHRHHGARVQRHAASRLRRRRPAVEPVGGGLFRCRGVRAPGQQHRPIRQLRRGHPRRAGHADVLAHHRQVHPDCRFVTDALRGQLREPVRHREPRHPRHDEHHVERFRPDHQHADRGPGRAADHSVLAALHLLGDATAPPDPCMWTSPAPGARPASTPAGCGVGRRSPRCWPAMAVLRLPLNLSVASTLIVADSSLGVGSTTIGAIASAGVLAYAVGKPFTGMAGDVLGGRRMFVAGMWATVAATVAFGVSTGAAMLTASWIANRFVQSAGWGALTKLVAQWFEPSRHGQVIAVLSLSYLFGDAAARLVLGAICRPARAGESCLLAGAMALELGGKRGAATAAGLIDTAGYLGALLSGVLVGALAQRYGWGTSLRFLSATMLAGSLVAGWLAWVERRRGQPEYASWT